MNARKTAVLLVVVAVAGLLLWFLWPKKSPGRFTVAIETSTTKVPESGRVELKALPKITGAGTRMGDLQPITYEWTASGGHLLDVESQTVTWVASKDPGTAVITVKAKGRGGYTAVGRVSMTVTSVDPQDELAKLKEGEKPGGTVTVALPGYKLPDIRFEKPKICADEDVIVRVEGAADPNGEDRWLVPRFRMGGFATNGFTVIARAGGALIDEVEDTEHKLGPQQAIVDILDDRSQQIVATKVVDYTVEDCHSERGGVVVTCFADRYQVDEARCTANVTAEGAVTSVDWEMGFDPDGKQPPLLKKTTPGTFATFEMPPRVEDRMMTSYLVRAVVHRADGSELEGRTNMGVASSYFESEELGGPLVLKVVRSLTVEQGADGAKARYFVTNPYSEPIVLDGAMEKFSVACDKPDLVPAGVGQVTERLSGTTLMPGQRMTFEWKAPHDAKVCTLEEAVSGHGQRSGRPAKGRWVLPTQGARQLSEHDNKRVQKALEILSQRRGSPVTSATEQELEDLQREGLIDEPDETMDDIAARPPGTKPAPKSPN